jgi:hypothetical protein
MILKGLNIIMLSKEDTYPIFDIDVGSLHQQSGKAVIIILEDGLLKEPTLGITGSENV